MTTLPVHCHMVSVVVLRGAGEATRTLALQRSEDYLKGAWSYVGGHVEAGESGWQAALRELDEETGLVPDSFYATSFCETFYMAAGDGVEVVPAFVARVADDAEVRINAEHAAWRWVTLTEAMDLYPFGSQRALLEHVQREFVIREPSRFLRIR